MVGVQAAALQRPPCTAIQLLCFSIERHMQPLPLALSNQKASFPLVPLPQALQVTLRASFDLREMPLTCEPSIPHSTRTKTP